MKNRSLVRRSLKFTILQLMCLAQAKIVHNFFLIFYLFEREKSQLGREAGRERGGSRLPAEQRA